MYNNISSKVMDGIRLRVRESSASILPEHKDDQRKPTYNSRYLPMVHLIAVICFLISISVAVILFERQLPPPLLKKDVLNNPNKFIAERAMDYLIKLTNIGPRTTGSYENEVLAVNFFVDEITAVMKKAKPIHSVLLDVQKASGAFTLTFFDGMTNVYRNVQNVIVKVGPNTGSHHSVLINCHFDTVSDSPGASDDGASCAIMLEILSVITQMDKPLKHNLIMLFNGAEENLMQASHGFITKHQWAKEVRAFINLEACGAGGREILFQAGPNHPWIMETYSQSVPYPYASSLAQEIFQSGVIPGDTDFRIFRDFGHVSGLDFAWSKNGYVYHTKFDNVHQIPLGTLQRTGENILALSLAMANNDKLTNTAKYASGNLVFFDFLGAFVIRWPEVTGFFINMCGVALSIYSIFRNMKTADAQGMSYRKYISQLGISLAVIIISVLLSLLANLLTAILLTVLGCTMSWYSQPIWVCFLYICPVIIVPMAAMSAWNLPEIGSPWVHFQIYNDAGLIIWTFVEFICTVLQIRSAFIALLWIVFLSLDNILQSTIFRHKRGSQWLIFYVGARLLPLLQCLYLILGATALYIPIMGRSGAGNNAEILVALLIGSKFSLLYLCFLPLILLVRDQKQILGVLSAVFLTALALLILTPIGFPYSSDPVSPAPQRFMLAHTHRIYHNAEDKVRNNESGYWVVDMDQNSPFSLKSLVPEVAQAKQIVEDCERELYCGLPYLMPVLGFIWKTHWIPSSMPNIPVRTHLYLNKSEMTRDHFKRLTFTITGPDHLGVMLSPAIGMKLERWSLLDEQPLAGPLWNGRDTYFIYYSCASDPEPWTFWIDLKGPAHVNQTSVDIAVTSHFLHGKAKVSPNFHQFIAQFPQWTAVTAWTATYESWKF